MIGRQASSLFRPNTGTKVTVLGSLDGDNSKPTPTWQCFLDGTLFGNATGVDVGSSQNAVVLCDSPNVADGEHEVDISVGNSGATFYFDYALYTPSTTVSRTNSVVKVANNDPNLNFSSGWDAQYAGSWPLAKDTGSQFTFRFNGEYKAHPREVVRF